MSGLEWRNDLRQSLSHFNVGIYLKCRLWFRRSRVQSRLHSNRLYFPLLLVPGRFTLPAARTWGSNCFSSSFSPSPRCFSCTLHPQELELPAAASLEVYSVHGLSSQLSHQWLKAQPLQVGQVSYHWPRCFLPSKMSLPSSLLFLLSLWTYVLLKII